MATEGPVMNLINKRLRNLHADLRERLNKIMALDYFTTTSELKGQVDVEAAVEQFKVAAQVPAVESTVPLPAVQAVDVPADEQHKMDFIIEMNERLIRIEKAVLEIDTRLEVLEAKNSGLENFTRHIGSQVEELLMDPVMDIASDYTSHYADSGTWESTKSMTDDDHVEESQVEQESEDELEDESYIGLSSKGSNLMSSDMDNIEDASGEGGDSEFVTA
ncbi:hypothetical protein QJS10_CPB14g00308 [Acorus calamus]|uniref:Uncharacterized protein n=1 Tax=Acorus calamus TaxID=4465 RepID=A0AAV9DFH9_ACOCL|nr:hypothetical protein QJS10_CPB14g00308 [Acorus calamus]